MEVKNMSDEIKGKKTIVLVDDNEMCLRTAELFLQKEYEVHKADSGSGALDYLTNNEPVPDLILLDIVMPKVTGWQVFDKIRAINRLKDVPIVFVTSLDDEEAKERAYLMGAADYITKPYNMVLLQRIVRNVLEK
jgi:PleD family two-component response regulator